MKKYVIGAIALVISVNVAAGQDAVEECKEALATFTAEVEVDGTLAGDVNLNCRLRINGGLNVRG